MKCFPTKIFTKITSHQLFFFYKRYPPLLFSPIIPSKKKHSLLTLSPGNITVPSYCTPPYCPADGTTGAGLGCLNPKLLTDPVGLAYGPVGAPVNCWTMARKLVGSVLRRVVGARREARVRLRAGLPTRPSMEFTG